MNRQTLHPVLRVPCLSGHRCAIERNPAAKHVALMVWVLAHTQDTAEAWRRAADKLHTASLMVGSARVKQEWLWLREVAIVRARMCGTPAAAPVTQ